MYTVRTIELRYGVTEGTVLGWIRSGQIKALNVGRTPGAKRPRWRITQGAVDAFEASRTATPPEPRARRSKPADVVNFYA